MPNAAEVFVSVRFNGNGRPSVDPDECHVKQNEDIAWRTAEGDEVPFEIEFEGESPAGPNAPRRLPSGPDAGRQRVRLTAANRSGRYKYAIVANGIRVDPAIIIDR